MGVLKIYKKFERSFMFRILKINLVGLGTLRCSAPCPSSNLTGEYMARYRSPNYLYRQTSHILGTLSPIWAGLRKFEGE